MSGGYVNASYHTQVKRKATCCMIGFVDIVIDYLRITIGEWVCGVIRHPPVALRFLRYAFYP